MLGNVSEYTADWNVEYSAEDQIDPPGPKGGIEPLIRGGSWGNNASFARASHRNFTQGGLRHPDLGLRCAGDLR
jgi:formylglycine-generating enzyme required for sulfatase activity